MRTVAIGLWAIGAAMLLSLRAFAGEAVDRTLAVQADGLVRIDNVRGRIDVQGWERSDVSVTGTLDDETESFTFETSGATTTVNVVTPRHLNRGDGSNLLIHVPQASRVRVNVTSAQLRLVGVRGGTDAKTVSGDVDASDLAGRIDLATVSGRIDLVRADGPVSFNSVSGDIDADASTEAIKIGTVSGDATVRSDKPVREITLHSVSGDISVSADLADAARVEGSTTSGNVSLAVNADAGAVVELRTTSGGIKNALTNVQAVRGIGGDRALEFTLGSGAGSIELRSVSGRLELLPR